MLNYFQSHYMVTDNAANMVKAFNMETVFDQQWEWFLQSEFLASADIGESEADDSSEDTGEQPCSNAEDTSDGDEYPDLVCDEEEEEEEYIEVVPDTRPKFLPCLAHTLQLVINEAVKDDPNAKTATVYLDNLVEFFRRRSRWRQELSTLARKELIKPVKTRWNSMLLALERLADVSSFVHFVP